MPLQLINSFAGAADSGNQQNAAATCVHLLFRALVEADGDAAVMHAGERPYLVAPTGAIELADCRLTAMCLESLIDQFLSAAAKRTLSASGLAHADCALEEDLPLERFTVAAARSLGDLRLELHRLRVPDEDHVPHFTNAARAGRTHKQYDDLTLPSADELWPEADAAGNPPSGVSWRPAL